MEEVKLLIGDRDVAAKSAGTFNRLNPLSGEVATKAAAAQVEDAIAAAEAAAGCGQLLDRAAASRTIARDDERPILGTAYGFRG